MTDAKPRMTEERWQMLRFWPLLAGSFLFLIAYSWRVISDLHGPGEFFALGIMGIIWILFAADYVVRLVLATSPAASLASLRGVPFPISFGIINSSAGLSGWIVPAL